VFLSPPVFASHIVSSAISLVQRSAGEGEGESEGGQTADYLSIYLSSSPWSSVFCGRAGGRGLERERERGEQHKHGRRQDLT
jgi:hypothetical protein